MSQSPDRPPLANSTGIRRPWWARPIPVLLIGVVLAGACVPFDGPIHRALDVFREGPWRLGGDVRRTLEFLQQFGDLASTIVIGIAALLLDPRVRARLLDWVIAAAATAVAIQALKMVIGRPRPRFDDPLEFVGPFRTYAVPQGEGAEPIVRYSWEIWKGSTSDLASMPSSHTSGAVALAVVLSRLYPPLTPLVASLACIVGVTRCLVGAHYVSDVIAGAAVAYAVSTWAMDGGWRAGRGK